MEWGLWLSLQKCPKIYTFTLLWSLATLYARKEEERFFLPNLGMYSYVKNHQRAFLYLRGSQPLWTATHFTIVLEHLTMLL